MLYALPVVLFKKRENTHEGALTLAITMRINEEHRRTDKTD